MKKKHTKIFDSEQHGQIAAQRRQSDNGPEVRFYWQPEGLGLCEFAIECTDTAEGNHHCNEIFDQLDQEQAAQIISGVEDEWRELIQVADIEDGKATKSYNINPATRAPVDQGEGYNQESPLPPFHFKAAKCSGPVHIVDDYRTLRQYYSAGEMLDTRLSQELRGDVIPTFSMDEKSDGEPTLGDYMRDNGVNIAQLEDQVAIISKRIIEEG